MNKIVELMRSIVNKYDVKNNKSQTSENPFMCTHFDTRNRNKNDKYKIPFDKPQCPIFNDNRCCGGCNLASKCEHSVACNCFGYTKGQLGGDDKGYYMHKASEYYPYGRLDNNGKFDWTYYKINKLNHKIKMEKFVIIKIDDNIYVAEIKDRIKNNGNFKCYICDLNCYKYFHINDLYENITYKSYEEAKRWIFND
jgi:hypothetical protein